MISFWVFYNALAWPVSMLLAIIVSHLTVGLIVDKQTNLIVGLVTATTIGFTQWRIFAEFVTYPKIWLFIPGILIGTPFSGVIWHLQTGNELPVIFETKGAFFFVLISIFSFLSGFIQSRMMSINGRDSFLWILLSGLGSAAAFAFNSFLLSGLVLGLMTLPVFILILRSRDLSG